MRKIVVMLIACISMMAVCSVRSFASGFLWQIAEKLNNGTAQNKYGDFETLDELLLYWQDNGSAGLNLAYYVALATYEEGQNYKLEYNGESYNLTYDELQIIKQWIDGEYSPLYNAETKSSDLLTVSDDVMEIIERQERFTDHYKREAERRIKEYMEVTITDFVLSCEEDSEAVKIITLHMKWDYWNGEERTRKMLEMYSDDMAAYLKESNPDIPIHKICIIWEAPYILENGAVAKHEYYDAGSYMMHSNSSGYLYGD